MKKSSFIAALLITLFITGCGPHYQTYRMRTVDQNKKMFLVTQEEIKGLKAGDTVQVSQSFTYPYNWEIKEGTASFSDTTYEASYIKHNGDTSWFVISKKIAVIESIVE